MDKLGHETRRLFQSLRRQWLPRPDLKKGFLKSLEGYERMQDDLQKNDDLKVLSQDMYPDLNDVITDKPEARRTRQSNRNAQKVVLSIPELHEMLHIIQTMEIAWMSANLSEFDAHPLNRGWAAAFHRWSMMPAFRRVWPVVRTDFSQQFIEYVESQCSLSVRYSDLAPIPGRSSKLRVVGDRLLDEFCAEWPEINPAFLTQPRTENPDVWYVYPSIRLCRNEICELKEVPLGFIVLLRPSGSADREHKHQEVFSCDVEAPELRLWVRPQHRYLGVGRHMLDRFATKLLELEAPQKRGRKPVIRVKAEELVWNSDREVVTRYFSRPSSIRGRNLRRQLELGLLYEYGFRTSQEVPQAPRSGQSDDEASDARYYGVDRKFVAACQAQDFEHPTILRTKWCQFFESAWAMSSRPWTFNEFMPATARR